jgi:hypothetical protein
MAVALLFVVAVVPKALRLRRQCGASGYHVFLSYRRAHVDFADRLKKSLERHGYSVFLDIDPDGGLGPGDFQAMLEQVLRDTPVVIPILTPAPAGPEDYRRHLSSMGAIKAAVARGGEKGRSLRVAGREVGRDGHVCGARQDRTSRHR